MEDKMILSNVRVVAPPCFFPHATDPKKHKCMLTVAKNHGNHRQTGQPLPASYYELSFWGKRAQTCALYLNTGKLISVEVIPRSRLHDTGRQKANGKKEIYRLTNWIVWNFEFGADSMKELSARVNGNLLVAKAAGMLDPNATVTAEVLLKTDRPAKYDYTPALAEQTGLYGNARVWIKDRGFIGGGIAGPGTVIHGTGAVVQPGAVIAPPATDLAAQMDALSAKMAVLKSAMNPDPNQAAVVNAGAPVIVDPFLKT